MKYFSTIVAGAITAVSAQSGYAGAANVNNPTFQASVNIDAAQQYQTMLGSGCSGAFGAACTSNTLSAADQDTVVKTLFDENIGTPSGPFNYTFPSANNDSCQLTLAQNAFKYNPDLYLYAAAWSAPGCFKTTGQEAGGGFICAVRRSNCMSDIGVPATLLHRDHDSESDD